MKKLTQSIRHAMNGISHSFSQQRNFRIMTVVAVIVIALGFLFKLSTIGWFLSIWAIGTVLISEMINTAVEYIINLICKTKDIHAKLAKDVAAGVVLLSVIMAVIVGMVVFVPKIVELF